MISFTSGMREKVYKLQNKAMDYHVREWLEALKKSYAILWKFLEKAFSVFCITGNITRKVQIIRIEENLIITRNRKIEKKPWACWVLWMDNIISWFKLVCFTYTMQLVGLEEEGTALACLPIWTKYKKNIITKSKMQKMTKKKKKIILNHAIAKVLKSFVEKRNLCQFSYPGFLLGTQTK